MSPESVRFSQNPVYREAEQWMLALHAHIRAGEGETSEADAIRDRLDVPWGQLSPEEVERLDGLSGDLYMLMGEETFVEVSSEQRQQLPVLLSEAFRARRFDEVLVLLRWNPSFLNRDQVPYIRARAWMELGHFAPAVLFFDHAASLAPENPSYPAFALTALVRGGHFEEAEQRARRYIEDKTTHPRLLFRAAQVLLTAARRSEGQKAKALYED
jgi:hypothetical protein